MLFIARGERKWELSSRESLWPVEEVGRFKTGLGVLVSVPAFVGFPPRALHSRNASSRACVFREYMQVFFLLFPTSRFNLSRDDSC